MVVLYNLKCKKNIFKSYERNSFKKKNSYFENCKNQA